MKHIGKITSLLGLGALLVAFNLGGAAGCGDSGTGGGGGGGVTNSDVTAAELTTALGNITSFADTSSSALTARLELAGYKSATADCTGDPSTGFTCPCEGGGSTTFTFGSSDDILEFNNCVDVVHNTVNGTATISSTSTGSTIEFSDFSIDLVTCGLFTIEGTEDIIDNGDGSADITIDLTGTFGGDTVNINGNLTSNADETISGDLDYTGAVTLSCTFNHDNLDICSNFADGCGIAASDICVSPDFTDYRTDLCE